MTRRGAVAAGAAIAVLAALAVVMVVRAQGPATRRRAVRPLAPAPAALAAASPTALGLALMRHMGGGNLVFSPDSVAAAMAMAGEGATGATAAQIAHALHLASPADFAQVGRLQATLEAEQTAAGAHAKHPVDLQIADDLFAQQGLPLLAPFKADLADDFSAAPVSVDFERDMPGAVRTINGWIGKRTHGLIAHALSPSSLPSETELALVNATYLNARWANSLSGERRDEPFRPITGGPEAVPFMHTGTDFPYAHGAGWSAVELAYAGSTLAMLLVLPEGERLEQLERRLDPSLLERITSALSTQLVDVYLPRFHISLSSSLVSPLKAMGITRAFTEEAQFPAISPVRLKLGEVLHAADIRVDEAGTEAAATTVVAYEPLAAGAFFVANRPFLFFVRDTHTGAILFAGRLADAATAQA